MLLGELNETSFSGSAISQLWSNIDIPFLCFPVSWNILTVKRILDMRLCNIDKAKIMVRKNNHRHSSTFSRIRLL